MAQDLDRLVDEIVKKVRDRLLAQGLRLPDKDIRPELEKALTSPVDIRELVQNGAARIGTNSDTHQHSPKELASMIDHTLLKQDATEADVKKLCEEARKHKFATVCLNSAFIPKAAQLLKGSGVKPIAVVGFPLGAGTTSAKAFEAREAIQNGAQEIDMVINVGEMKSTNYNFVLEDIRGVVEASKPYPVKVILETSLLDYEQKTIACALAKAAGAAFVKTSTGFASGGATAEDIALMRKIVGPEMGVKASGGIRTTEDAERMIKAGATRIGASASVAIVEHAGETAKKSDSGKGDAKNKNRKPFAGLPYKAGAGHTETKKPPKGGSSSGGSSPKGGGY